MSTIKKSYKEIHEFNVMATAYLIKTGHADAATGKQTEKKDKTKLDAALIDLVYKQIVKKINPKKMDAILRIEIKNALVDPTTKQLLIAEKANQRFGIEQTYHYSIEGKLKCLDEIDALGDTQVEIHSRIVPAEDLPEITEEEKEAFAEYIVIEAKK